MAFKTLSTKRSVVLAKIESAYGVDAAPNATDDAVDAGEPGYEIDQTMIESLRVSTDLDKFEDTVGRKLATMTFTVEVRGNGKTQSGLLSDESKIGRLIRACGYQAYAVTGALCVGKVVPDFASSAIAREKVTWVAGGTPALAKPVLYTVTVTQGGGSGVAEVSVTNNDADEGGAALEDVVVTSGDALDLGDSLATITPTFTGTLLAGDIFRVLVTPTGVGYKLISDNFPSITLDMYMDDNRHKILGAMGTFTVTATSGETAKMEFSFQGQHQEVVTLPMPEDPVYDQGTTPMVELSNLTWGSESELVVGDWSFEQGNNLVPRPDVNSREGYKGYRITDRTPVGGMTPEATLESEVGFWAQMSKGRPVHFSTRVGQERGNMVVCEMPRCQISGMPYSDRDMIVTYDISFGAKRFKGNDSVRWIFC
jgi:hypothetical protein